MSDEPKPIKEDAEPTTKTEAEANQSAEEYSKSSDIKQNVMSVKVSSPFRTYFDGMVFSISGENDTGPFDILPKHHNFISLLKACTLIIRTTKGEEQKIDISGGLMHVKADSVVVFLDI